MVQSICLFIVGLVQQRYMAYSPIRVERFYDCHRERAVQVQGVHRLAGLPHTAPGKLFVKNKCYVFVTALFSEANTILTCLGELESLGYTGA
jgi:hypothetical protein